MEISIIIPCHNLENYIERCLQSILSQDYNKDKYEIIMVFDTCTDKTEQIANKCLENSGVFFKFFKTTCKRAGISRNIGLENSQGRYVYFVDGDDYLIDKNAFNKLVKCIQKNKSNAVYMTCFECEDKHIIDNEAIWRFFYERSIIGTTRFTMSIINEDWEFTGRVRRNKYYKESKIDDILYHYTYPREGSITAGFRALHPDLYK